METGRCIQEAIFGHTLEFLKVGFFEDQTCISVTYGYKFLALMIVPSIGPKSFQLCTQPEEEKRLSFKTWAPEAPSALKGCFNQ